MKELLTSDFMSYLPNTVISFYVGVLITLLFFRRKRNRKTRVTITKTLPATSVTLQNMQYRFIQEMFKDIKGCSALKMTQNDNDTMTATLEVLVDSERVSLPRDIDTNILIPV